MVARNLSFEIKIEEFESRDAASRAAAECIASALERRLELQGQASVVVSGGTTPVDCFGYLSVNELDWPNVHIVPSDERWVPPEHGDSNEHMIRSTLMTADAASAELQSLYAGDVDIEDRCTALDAEILERPFPFACALLGMGEDGHFASLFPDADTLEDGLAVDTNRLSIAVNTAASPHPRISLTLAALSRSDEIVLLIFGDKKLDVLQRAYDVGNGFPVSRLLTQKRAPVTVYWAP